MNYALLIGSFIVTLALVGGLFWLLEREPKKTYYTIDGGKLAPYAGMTDADLAHYESVFDIEPRS